MSRLVCPSCGRTLYRKEGDGGLVDVDGESRAKGSEWERAEGVQEAKRGNRIECPEHGVVSPRVIPDGSLRVEDL